MEVGDKIQLKNQEVEVEDCEKCGHKMVNLDAEQLAPGDLTTLKNAGVRISNPETSDPICISCEADTWGHKLNHWFEDDNNNNDDSGFFGGSSGGLFGGGGFGGGFGGFGGGSFSGGGASGGF